MKASTPTRTSKRDLKGSGVVQIAVWKDSAEAAKWQDVFTNYSTDVFYDFSKPLRLLDGPGWHSSIRTSTQEEHFVFSVDEKY
ncbi:MAG: hypothetical protein JWQ35_2036 [Bacteriovoracaceae bacterium]|nr:hypothetical protein [Bacteriovoracaceae bacterium]